MDGNGGRNAAAGDIDGTKWPAISSQAEFNTTVLPKLTPAELVLIFDVLARLSRGELTQILQCVNLGSKFGAVQRLRDRCTTDAAPHVVPEEHDPRSRRSQQQRTLSRM